MSPCPLRPVSGGLKGSHFGRFGGVPVRGGDFAGTPRRWPPDRAETSSPPAGRCPRYDCQSITYLRDRLTVARDLLTDSGSIFVQMGDENMHRIRGLLDEVFGANNF